MYIHRLTVTRWRRLFFSFILTLSRSISTPVQRVYGVLQIVRTGEPSAMRRKATAPSTPDRSSYHHGTLRQSLLEAGEALLREKGFKGFTLRECARRAGVSHAAPKHHFGDVKGFLTEIAAGGFDELTRMLRERIADATTLDEEFIATTRAYVEFAQAQPEHFRIMFRDDLLCAESDRLATAMQLTFTELTNVILRQRGEPEIRCEEVERDQSIVAILDDIMIGWCHVHGLAHLILERQLPPVPAELQDGMLITVSTRLAQLIQHGGKS